MKIQRISLKNRVILKTIIDLVKSDVKDSISIKQINDFLTTTFFTLYKNNANLTDDEYHDLLSILRFGMNTLSESQMMKVVTRVSEISSNYSHSMYMQHLYLDR